MEVHGGVQRGAWRYMEGCAEGLGGAWRCAEGCRGAGRCVKMGCM